MSKAEENFSKELRDYQLKIISEAEEHNVIVFLPTGSGKTFIAVQVIRSRSWEIRKKIRDGGKRTFFLVCSKALVSQQAKVIEECTDLVVGSYSGDMNVDLWNAHMWGRELDQNNVLVMTAEIMRNMLEQRFISLSDVNVLIFDECHHAVGDSPYSAIMSKFDDIPKSKQPTVLGLTATLVNANIDANKVDDTVRLLESTFRAKVSTADNISAIARFSADPDIVFIEFKKSGTSELTRTVNEIVDDCLKKISKVKFPSDVYSRGFGAPIDAKLHLTHHTKKRVYNNISDIVLHLAELGNFGASMAAMCHMRTFENMKFHCENKFEKKLYDYVIHVCNALITVIRNDGKSDNVSSKVHTLFKILHTFRLKFLETKMPLKCLIFVKRRSTALILHNILKLYSEIQPELSFILHDFIIGNQSTPFKYMQDEFGAQRKSSEVLRDFENGTLNTLVTTNVVEEGIDIQTCNLVVRFDECVDYRSFIQSKGRARHKSGFYVVMTNDKAQAMTMVTKHENTENALGALLIGHTDERDILEPDGSKYMIPTFYLEGPDGPHITEVTAIPTLMRYCDKLPQDKYSHLAPTWWEQGNVDDGFIWTVQLPMVSPLREKIRGACMKSKKMAKRSAAMETCKKLHNLGELNGIIDLKQTTSDFDSSSLFPHWERDPNLNFILVSNFPSIIPSCLYNCRPRLEFLNKMVYLHILKFTPVVKQPVGQISVLQSLINQFETFALFSTKPIPKIYDFPVYLGLDEVTCSVVVNATRVLINKEQLIVLEKFHDHLFSNFLPLRSSQFRKDELSTSYLVIPVKKEESGYDIHWTAVLSCLSVDAGKHCSKTSYDFKIVRTKNTSKLCQTHYFVTDVYSSSTAQMSLAHNIEYFRDKFGVTLRDMSQPILQVRQLTDNLNMLSPKKINSSEDVEYLVPEICECSELPAELCVKAIMVPSALYRIHIALCVDDFRREIVSETRIGQKNVEFWLPLEVDVSIGVSNNLNAFNEQARIEKTPSLRESGSSQSFQDSSPSNVLIKALNYATDTDFITEGCSNIKLHNGFNEHILLVLNRELNDGPELKDLVAAFTAKRCHDIVNLERLETLGDSFLKLAVSLYLYCKYSLNEGILTTIKTKLVSNENLYYCGKYRKIPSFCVAKKINISSEWIPPSFVTNESQNTDIRASRDYLAEKVAGQSKNSTPNDVSVKNLGFKAVADCVEALIGCYVNSCGISAGFSILKWLDILPSSDPLATRPTPPSVDHRESEYTYHLRTIDCHKLEKILNYQFRNRGYLLQALTHPSFNTNCSTECYQRLEFLGDAILDFLITSYIFENCKTFSPDQISNVRSSLVNNVTFACLAVRHGLHRFLLSLSAELQAAICNFVFVQEKRNHQIGDCIYILSDVKEYSIAEAIEVPKAISDLFESLAGAIYLDSGNSLNEVWRVFYNLMSEEIESFTKNVSMNPVQLLHMKASPVWTTKEKLDGSNVFHVQCDVAINGNIESFNGYGKSIQFAKKCAATAALSSLSAKL